MPNIIYNAIRTPDGVVIASYGVHDYVCHTDRDGNTYAVDGGLSYLRRLGDRIIDCEELSLTDEEPHSIQREVIKWGTYGKSGNQPFTRKSVAEMTTGHIVAVLTDCRPSYVHEVCMWQELLDRLDLEYLSTYNNPDLETNLWVTRCLVEDKLRRLKNVS